MTVPYWKGHGTFLWSSSASEILNEQGSEESIQNSVDAILIPTENTIQWGIYRWNRTVSEILNGQAREEAQ
ncbi:hypothetical protein OG21DRAFT_1512126 [Imleria badia]|nr:hypothetical protein OG21DRAFT_1512126 [Imleria badia]